VYWSKDALHGGSDGDEQWGNLSTVLVASRLIHGTVRADASLNIYLWATSVTTTGIGSAGVTT
jgi:hypothetical protein